MNTAHFKLIIRTDRKNIDGQCGIYLYANVNGQKKYFTTKKYIRPEHWNPKKQEVKSTAPNFQDTNETIQLFLNKARTWINKANFEDKAVSATDLENLLRSNTLGASGYLDFVRAYMEKYPNKYASKTLDNFLTHARKIEAYRPNIQFNQINLEFWNGYQNYLKSLGNQQNTIHKQSQLLKKFLNIAVDLGKIENNPLKKVSVKQLEGNRQFLSLDEVNALESLLNENERLKEKHRRVIRYFLFSCYTGLRFGDVQKLKFKHLFNLTDPQKAEIRLIMNKTERPLTIPLNNRALALLPKTNLPNAKVFHVYGNQVTNRILKEIAVLAKIRKNLTSHCARHTAGTLYLTLSGNVAAVQKLLGHANIKTTLIYAKITENVKRETVNLFDKV